MAKTTQDGGRRRTSQPNEERRANSAHRGGPRTWVDLHTMDSAAVMTEYVLTLSLVTIGAAAAITPLYVLVGRLYRFVVWAIDLPLPLS